MSADPYQDYLNSSSAKLSRLRRRAKARAKGGHLRKSRYGRGWSHHDKVSAEHLNARLARSSDPLAVKTRREVLLQARGNVNAAFAPDEAALNQQEQRARNVDSKRKADEQYFSSWLNTQQAKMDAQSRAAQDALAARQREIEAQQQQQHAQATTQVARQGAAEPGAVTSAPVLAGGTAAQGVSDASQYANEQLQAQQTRTNAQIASGQQGRSFSRAAVILGEKAADASRARDLFTSLQDIADNRQQVALKKAAAASDEVARLLDNNVKVAQGQQELQLAGVKLGVQAKHQANQDKLASKRLKLDYKDYLRKLSKDQLDAHLKRIDQKLKARGLSNTERSTLEKKRHDIATEGISRGKGKRSQRKINAGARKAWGQYYSVGTTARGLLKKFHGDQGRVRRELAHRGVSAFVRNIALDLAMNGRLNPHNAQVLRDRGVHVPRQYIG